MDSASFQPEQLLTSPEQLPSRGGSPKELAQVHPKDEAMRLGKEPDKKSQEPQDLMKLCRSWTVVTYCNDMDSLVEPCYCQISWPEEVLQKWAKEKEERERNLCQDLCQDAAIGRSNTLDEATEEQPSVYGELELKKSDSCST